MLLRCKPRSTPILSTSTTGSERADFAKPGGATICELLTLSLKVKFQRQLHRPISARTRDSSEGRRIVHRGTGSRPRRVVSQVVRLGAELDAHSLHRVVCLEHRKIDVH